MENDRLRKGTFEEEGGLSFSYLGPDLKEGPLPAIFYFSLSEQHSLLIDPFNQPVLCLQGLPLRIFSTTLPCHGNGIDPNKAVPFWAEEFRRGKDPLASFIIQMKKTLLFLKQQEAISSLGLMGLSRGVLIASHIASSLHFAKYILGFSPLTKLSAVSEFDDIQDNPLVTKYNLEMLIDNLYDRTFRFYISNYDRRVKTENTFSFIHLLAKQAHEQRIRSAPIELYIKPPLGYQGHGTSKEIFEEGAKWLWEKLSQNTQEN